VRDNSEAANIGALRAEYRRLAVEWDEARDDPAQANRLFDRLHALSKDIKENRATAKPRFSVS
jgi:hypothetical protein